MTDDLGRELRERLGRATLPTAPSSLRDEIHQPPRDGRPHARPAAVGATALDAAGRRVRDDGGRRCWSGWRTSAAAKRSASGPVAHIQSEPVERPADTGTDRERAGVDRAAHASPVPGRDEHLTDRPLSGCDAARRYLGHECRRERHEQLDSQRRQSARCPGLGAVAIIVPVPGGPTEVRILDPLTSRSCVLLELPGGVTADANWSPSGDALAIAASDGSLYVWSAMGTTRPMVPIRRHDVLVTGWL